MAKKETVTLYVCYDGLNDIWELGDRWNYKNYDFYAEVVLPKPHWKAPEPVFLGKTTVNSVERRAK